MSDLIKTTILTFSQKLTSSLEPKKLSLSPRIKQLHSSNLHGCGRERCPPKMIAEMRLFVKDRQFIISHRLYIACGHYFISGSIPNMRLTVQIDRVGPPDDRKLKIIHRQNTLKSVTFHYKLSKYE